MMINQKLSLLDLEKKIGESCPFQPTFYSADKHHNKQHEEDSNRAKPYRKGYISDLSSVDDNEDIEFTYRPRVNKKKIRSIEEADYVSQPVHLRLYEKAKTYQDNLARRSEEIYTKDDSGHVLFQPRINHPGSAGDDASASSGGNMAVQDFLYRDAMVCCVSLTACIKMLTCHHCCRIGKHAFEN